jgi:leucyl aminopeptidase
MKTAIIESRDLPADVATKTVIEFAFEGFKQGPSAGEVQNLAFGSTYIDADKFSGAKGVVTVQARQYAAFAPLGHRDVMWAGLGDYAEYDRAALRAAATAAFRKARELGMRDIVIAAPRVFTKVSAFDFAETVIACAGMIDYTINHQKGAKLRYKEPVRFDTVSLWSSSKVEELAAGVHAGHTIANAVNHARDLANEPAETCTADKLVGEARRLAGGARQRVELTVFNKKGLSVIGAGAILAVNRGSENEAAMIVATYTPETPVTDKVIVLVGKSVTFDTGGLDLKAAAGMRQMKRDMAGGAATLAAFEAIVKLKLPMKVVLIMAATDNAIGPKAYKPGDVIKTMSGITVEVDNTDAEGRLTLADAIWYAKLLRPDYIIDLATLTGAVRSIGGDIAAGGFSNDDKFLALVDAAATAGGERIQPLRMWNEARALNDSTMADLKNSGGDPGSLTAAWFIREFVDYQFSVTWAHLDIAAVAHRAQAQDQDPKEATGWGVRTLVELVRALSSADANK